MQVRLVVTGHNAKGRSVFVHDQQVDAMTIPCLGELAMLLSADEPGFHRTDTTDFGVLTSGNLAVQLDDGAEAVLNPGDVFIENGTRHRWRVVGDKPATMVSFIVGANPR